MSRKNKNKLPEWEPNWISPKERLPEEGSLVVFFDGEKEFFNTWISGSWTIVTKAVESNPDVLRWRVFTQDDLSKKIEEMEGYILQEYISGKLKGWDLEKMYGIKIEN